MTDPDTSTTALAARADLAATGAKGAAGTGEATATFDDGPAIPDYLIADGPTEGER